MLRLPHQPVWDICAGGGLAWALYGNGNNTRLARFGRIARPRFMELHAPASWCAADSSGVWITTADGRLLHVGRWSNGVAIVARVPGAFTLDAGGGSVWVAARGGIARFDERSHRVQTFALGGWAAAVSVGADRVWVVANDHGGRSTLLRLDWLTGRIEARRRLPASPTDVLEQGGHVWLGGLDATRRPTLWSVQPTTLEVHRLATLG
jgi:hypothetical protein